MEVVNLSTAAGIAAAAALGLGKVGGLCRAARLNLPGSRTALVARNATDCLAIQDDHADLVFLCRPDAPEGQTAGLPRGRDLPANELGAFLIRCQSVTPAAALVIFPHPSYAIAGRYVARYELAGAVNVLVNVGAEIVIEYVGRGFDVGELSRGKSVHATLPIAWEDRFMDASTWLKTARRDRTFRAIERSEYLEQRNERLLELTHEFGIGNTEVETAVPEIVPILSTTTLKRVQLDVIDPLLEAAETGGLPRVSTTLANLYDSGTYVFEVWIRERTTTA